MNRPAGRALIASICRLACRHFGGSFGRTVACAALRNDPRWSTVECSKQIYRRGPCPRGCLELVRTPSIAPICQPAAGLQQSILLIIVHGGRSIPLDPFVRIRGSTSSMRIRTQYGSARFSNICFEQNNEFLFQSRSAGLKFDFTVSGSLLVLQ